MPFTDIEREPSILRGAIAGAAAGLVASWVMNQFQASLSKASQLVRREKGDNRSNDAQDESRESSDDATMKAASAVTRRTVGRDLRRSEKRVAGPLVHYAFGAAMGAVYGALAERAPVSSRGFGLPFATALWVGADELAVPALGLSKRPAEYPISTHASALAAHWVYGATAECVRRAVRRVI